MQASLERQREKIIQCCTNEDPKNNTRKSQVFDIEAMI